MNLVTGQMAREPHARDASLTLPPIYRPHIGTARHAMANYTAPISRRHRYSPLGQIKQEFESLIFFFFTDFM